VRDAPPLCFTDYFLDQNHVHNIDEDDVNDAYYGRRVQFSKIYDHDGHSRREVLAKNDDTFMIIIVEPTENESGECWQVITAMPAGDADKARARRLRVGDFLDE